MPDVFTFFNHGTAFHRDKEGEIIAEFGRAAAGVEYEDFLILDGPGSRATTAPVPGQFNPFTRDRAPKRVFGNAEMGHTHINWQTTGLLSGAGWDDNVIHAIAALSELDPLPSHVNMIGWSRGAVTCTKLAYRLAEIYPDIEVNIFAVDPVAGIGNKSARDASTLRENVRNYLAILSMHETRGFFKPQDIKRVTVESPDTNAIFLPFPGNHSGQVSLDKNWVKGVGDAAQLVWSLGMQFLQHFGTRFATNPSPVYGLQETCNLYAKMQLRIPDYRKTSPGFTGALMGGRKERDFLRNRHHQYVKNARFFINEHHRRTFKQAYPRIYDWVFGDRGTDTASIVQEFRSTKNLLALHETLGGLGFHERPGLGLMLPLRGSGKEEARILAAQHTSNLPVMGI